MISVNRESSTPIFEQVAGQLRYLVATGHFHGRKVLPSTRKLGASLGISFHTVRKAYRMLESEGILEAVVGSGFRVKDRSPLSTSERIEQGAAIIDHALHQLVSLGLVASDIEYLFDEALERSDFRAQSPSIVFVSSSEEISLLCAAEISSFIQSPVDSSSLLTASKHRDADLAVCEYRDLGAVRELLPKCETLGVAVHLSTKALDRVARLLPSETIGLLTAEGTAIRYIAERIKFETKFSGQILATASANPSDNATELVKGVDLLLYTPSSARRARALSGSVPSAMVSVEIADRSKREALEAIPS